MMIREGLVTFSKALVYIRNDPQYVGLQGLTHAIIFLGTPHNGSAHASIGSTLANIARITFRRSARQVLQALEANSSALLDLTMSFKPLHAEVTLVSFCEQLPMSVGFVSTHHHLQTGTVIPD